MDGSKGAPHYDADEDAGSLAHQPPSPTRTDSENNRGQRAEAVNGAVQGAGAGAGSGGAPEDFDSDTANGGGSLSMKPKRAAPTEGADAPSHGGR